MTAEVIVVAKRTAYSLHVDERHDPDVARLLETSDPSVARWLEAHEDHQRTLESVSRILDEAGARVTLVFGPSDELETTGARLVVTVGGDGTLLTASHHVADLPILGVNSSPRHSVGFFCAARADNLPEMLRRALENRLPKVQLARMQVAVGEAICSKRVLNEALFCHSIPAATSRYIVEYGGHSEEQRSSGIWVGTAAGSTGAIRSAGGKVLPFSSDKLQLVVREPYSPRGERYRFSKLVVGRDEVIRVRNKMQSGRLFLDGPFAQFDVRLGDSVNFSISNEPLSLLGLRGRSKVVSFRGTTIEA